MKREDRPGRPWNGWVFELIDMMNINEYYEKLWARRFDIQSEITRGGVNNDFAKGRRLHPAFLFRLEDESIVNKIVEVQTDLGGFDFFDPFPKEYLHITIKVLGFINEPKVYSNDLTRGEVDAIAEHASDAFSSFSRFDITLYGINLVPLVSFIQVKDDGIFGQLNNSVLKIPDVKKREHRDFPNFMPHMTISRFNSREDMSQLAGAIENNRYRDKIFGTTEVRTVELVIVHLDGDYPVFETVERYDLR